MNNREAIHKLESMRNTCQKLIDEKVKFERLVGKDVTGTWNAETPFDDTCQNLIEALTFAIAALEKLEAIKSCTPPSDDWESYADRLHDIAYKCGYEQGKQEAERWISCKERLPEEYGEYRITWKTSRSEKRLIADAEYEPENEYDAVNREFIGRWLLEDNIRYYPDVEVIAWKPIEEPYTEEDNE